MKHMIRSTGGLFWFWLSGHLIEHWLFWFAKLKTKYDRFVRSQIEYVDARAIANAGKYLDQYRLARVIADERVAELSARSGVPIPKYTQKAVHLMVCNARVAQKPERTRNRIRNFSLLTGNA